MRPVERGAHPQNVAGEEVEFSSYQKARGELIRRLGEYCSYCEMHSDSDLAVEHIQPKKPPGTQKVIRERELAWSNFLLACKNCNSTKSNTDVVLADYLWPDRDDTFHALNYKVGGIVEAAEGTAKSRAERLINLVGLDKQVDSLEASDRRWQNRREAWDIAEHSKRRLAQCTHDAMRDQIIEHAKAKGYWSIWMTVFADNPDMVARLLHAWSGTRTSLFDLS